MDEALKKYQSTKRHESSQNDSKNADGFDDNFEKPKNLELGERPSSAKRNKIDDLQLEVEFKKEPEQYIRETNLGDSLVQKQAELEKEVDIITNHNPDSQASKGTDIASQEPHLDLVRSCIAKISALNKIQTDRAFKETQRNRKVKSIGFNPNMSIG